ncbi:hypothetical protein GCM10009416_29630 [Craurococcus roseus]|uniref:Uncharacterized protein n=1 Tax=Craurococcus roseus TaxID=77585 RepID=A0ABN1FEH6_9PROT
MRSVGGGPTSTRQRQDKHTGGPSTRRHTKLACPSPCTETPPPGKDLNRAGGRPGHSAWCQPAASNDPAAGRTPPLVAHAAGGAARSRSAAAPGAAVASLGIPV